MRHFRILALSFATSAAAACGGAAAPGDGDQATKAAALAATLEYVGTCTPSACANLPVPQVACATPETTTSVCEPSGAGQCVVDIECGSSTAATAPLCEPSACGPAVSTIAPACAPGGTIVNSCTKIGATCEWQPLCVRPNGAACTPGSCGPEPTLAPVCPDTRTGSLVCVGTGNGACAWVGSCSGTAGRSPASGADGGSASSSPANDAGADFDAAAWADATGL